MIVVEPQSWEWDDDVPHGQIEPVTVFTSPHERISDLLGPDGEPLLVPYERPALGFDLRPKSRRDEG